MYYMAQPGGRWGTNGWNYIRYIKDEDDNYIPLTSLKDSEGQPLPIVKGPD